MTAATLPNAGVPALARSRRQARDGSWRDLAYAFFKLLDHEQDEEREEREEGHDEEVRAAGVAVKSPDGRLLFVRRSDQGDHQGEWAFPGGKLDGDETPEEAARRELKEETGYEAKDLRPIHQNLDLHVHGDADVSYHTFMHDAGSEFEPKLDGEHTEHRWASPSEPPSPLHPGVRALLSRDAGLANDPPVSEKQRRAMWAAAEGHSSLGIPEKVGREFVGDQDQNLSKSEVQYEETSKSETDRCKACAHFRQGDLCDVVAGQVAHDAWCNRFARRVAYDHNLDPLAWDRGATVREFDKDGRLHVSAANISKAAVNPYLGREIPGADGLGLEPGRIYWLLRDPDELEKAADTFNGVPIVIKHVPTSADDHPADKVIGATGNDAAFEYPYLRNSLVIWPKEAIDGVEDASQKELSCGYHYKPDMKPGEFEGVKYDGVMREIVGNHVALVKKGRAGSDVVVGDAALPDDHANLMITIPETEMAKTRLGAYIGGSLTQFFKTAPSNDALLALDAAVGDLTAATLKARKPVVKAALRNIRDLFAKDADLEGMNNHVDKLEAPAKDAPLDLDPNEEGEQKKDVKDDEPEFLKGAKAEDRAALDAHFRKKYGRDEETPEEKKAREDKAAHDRRRAHDDPPPFEGMPKPGGKMVTEDQMNNAIAVAVREANKGAIENASKVREAYRAVKPWVGELTTACDTADEVFRAALRSLGVRCDDVHASALPRILQLTPKPGKREGSRPMAEDSLALASDEDFLTRFPGMKTARVI